MKPYQRGASTLDLLIAFSFALTLCLLLLPTVYRTLELTTKARALKNDVAQVVQASNIWYGKEIMRTRCLTLQHPLTIGALMDEGLVDRQIQTLDWNIEVTSIDNDTNPLWNRPTRFVITVTVPDEGLRNAMHQALSPLSADNSALIFDAPIHADIANTLAIMDRNTGCLE
ncbi:hypothetical protein TUM4438_40400 [Shewanella sairae]|uniref:Pilus assembly protein n=1 Tax=Shewanella sairae TaxID=190310 RepID=A0ABQ4PQL4_9GAMM|nr:hypothetical protein [Shewanella sairae]MCL1132244.1 hypothetical protein [Shewanella sairae]GIU51292.1 hypothetical protein TUM4438_40400 [Shewanella sairae]